MHRLIRPLFAVVMTGCLVLAAAGTASAHVTVNPRTASEGGYAKLSFRVPNEKDTADTTQLDIQIPTDHPIASVSVQPVRGWTYKVTKTTLATPMKTDDGQVTEAVSQITWTGGTIKPGEFNEFSISAGPLPSGVTSISFKALQTYSDGDVVRWIEESKPGQPAPAHPAPVLTLTKAAASDTAAASTGTAASSTKSSDGTARTLGTIGIIVGALGLAGAAFAMTRRGSAPAAPTASTPTRPQPESVSR